MVHKAILFALAATLAGSAFVQPAEGSIGLVFVPSQPWVDPGREAAARAKRVVLDQARREALRTQRALSIYHLTAIEITDSQQALQLAYRSFYMARDTALSELQASDEYHSLRAQLWEGTEAIRLMRDKFPADQDKIEARSKLNLQLRDRLVKMEQVVTDNDDKVMGARDALTDSLRQYLKALADAADRVRNDPRMIEASRRLRVLEIELASGQ